MSTTTPLERELLASVASYERQLLASRTAHAQTMAALQRTLRLYEDVQRENEAILNRLLQLEAMHLDHRPVSITTMAREVA